MLIFLMPDFLVGKSLSGLPQLKQTSPSWPFPEKARRWGRPVLVMIHHCFGEKNQKRVALAGAPWHF